MINLEANLAVANKAQFVNKKRNSFMNKKEVVNHLQDLEAGIH